MNYLFPVLALIATVILIAVVVFLVESLRSRFRNRRH